MPQGDYLLLVTSQDCQPDAVISRPPAAVIGLQASTRSQPVRTFEQGAIADALSGYSKDKVIAPSSPDWADALINAAHKSGVTQIVTPQAALGDVATQLDAAKSKLEKAGIGLHQIQRGYDVATWPHATRGFFKLKKKIPSILADLKLGGN